MKTIAFALLAAIATTPSRAEEQGPTAPVAERERHDDMNHAAPPPACAEAKPQCAQTVEPTFARDGRLRVAFSVGEKVYAASSRDNGKSFDPAVVVANVTGIVIAPMARRGQRSSRSATGRSSRITRRGRKKLQRHDLDRAFD